MKRFLLILTAIMLVFAVVGCNSNGAPTTVNDKLQPGAGPGGEEGGDEGGDEFTITELLFAQGDSADPVTGKGNIEGEDFAKIKAAKVGSFVRMSYDLTDYSDGFSNVGWGFGKIGNVGGQEFELKTKGEAVYDEDITVENFLKGVEESQTWVFINVWNDAKVTKVELHAKN